MKKIIIEITLAGEMELVQDGKVIEMVNSATVDLISNITLAIQETTIPNGVTIDDIMIHGANKVNHIDRALLYEKLR